MCEEWQPYSCGIFPPSSGRRRSEGAEVGSPWNEKKWEETFPRFVIPSAAEGSFSLAVRRRVFDSRERETPYRGKAEAVLPLKGLAKGSWEKGTKRFLAFARNDDAKRRHSFSFPCKGTPRRRCARNGSPIPAAFSLLPSEGGAPKGQRLAHSRMKRNGKRSFPVSSSRAQPRDLFRFPFPFSFVMLSA